MGEHYRVRTTWMAILVAGLLAVGATSGLVSLSGNRHGDVARAADASRPFTDRGPTVHPTRVPPVRPQVAPARPHRAAPPAALLVRITSAMTVRARPGLSARAIGTLVSSSKYYHVGLTAWVEATARHGSWGRVEIPYVWPRRDGWIPLRGLQRSQTFTRLQVDLSAHRITVTKFGKTQFVVPAATGATSSPTPPGEYFVTDRIPFPAGGPLGSFAFGISGIQPNLPAGWSGGNQLAIHGTSDPSSIGTSASAGCMRVSERTLRRLMPLLKLGTPVIVER